MKKRPAKIMQTGRISRLAKRIIEAERAHTGESEGEIMERCIVAQISTPEARRIMREEIDKDPSLATVFAKFLDSPELRKNAVLQQSARKTRKH